MKNKKSKVSFTKEELASLKEAGFGDAVDIGEYSGPAEDLVIIEDNTKTLVGVVFVLNTLARILVLVVLTVLIYLGLSYKLVPAKVCGSTFDIGSISLVSRYAEPNIGEIREGSIVLVRDTDYSDLSPVVLRFSVYEVTGRNGFILTCKNEDGKQAYVEVSNVLYLLKTD